MKNDSFSELKNRSLFSRLKRLFSTDVIIRNIGGKKLKIIDTDQIQYTTSGNSLRDRFNRLRSSNASNLSRDFNLAYQSSRVELFRDFDTMALDPILASALDIYADECTSKNELGEVISVRSSNDDIKSILENLFYDILNIEFNLWSWTRSMVKYGDFYLRLHISPEYGVFMVDPISCYNIKRLENYDQGNKNDVRFEITLPEGNGKMDVLENYEIAHFRLLQDTNFIPYGTSMLDGARRIWKQLTLMEDAMLIHRIMRAPEKRKFKIDIGNIPPNEIDNYMEQIMNQMKKVPYIDEQTGDYNLRFNLTNMVEDFFLPVRGSDSGTDISTLDGLEWTGIDDIEYLRNKMMSALKIPKAFLGYEEGLCISPDTEIHVLKVDNNQSVVSASYKTIKDVIDEFNSGIENYTFSYNETTKQREMSKIEWAGYTRLNTDVIQVNLSNGNYIICTPDHLFLTEDEEWIEAQLLVKNQKLMQFVEYDPINFYKTEISVSSIEHLSTKIDTCDLTIKDNHNFATKAGVIVHNSGKSTLAAEDIRFARTIQRIQRIMLSELNKIAVIHLFSQGYRDESLVDFELELTNPSTIFEKEKIEIWKSKVELSSDMQESKLFSKKWVYENVFNLSDKDMVELQTQLVDDSKSKYRFDQIEQEGSDPAIEPPKLDGSEDGDNIDSESGDEGSGDAENFDLDSESGDDTDTGDGESTSTDAGGDGGSNQEPSLNEKIYKKKKKKRDQTGRKKASDYRFGEDPLGRLEINRRENMSYGRGMGSNSALALESYSDMFNKIQKNIMLIENKDPDCISDENYKNDSYMDEKNIKE
jgi:hypothetical protein